MTASPTRLCIRTATMDDLDGLYALALTAGPGLTNLPPDRAALERRLTASIGELEASDPGDASPMMLVLEADGRIAGTGMVLSRVGAEWPFYSYKVSRLTQSSRELKKVVTVHTLNLVNDFEGCAEVGGLFLGEGLRGLSAGKLISRSRYLFMAEHRYWFGDYIVAELRGLQNEDGSSPFWEGVGRCFYKMDFDEADKLNSLRGNQFIADLGPKNPIYIELLPQSAQDAIGKPHADGRRAFEMLLHEGFRDEDYVDIFDGGPTVYCLIDELKAVRDARTAPIVRADLADGEGTDSLISFGHAKAFRCTRGRVVAGDAGVAINALAAEVLGVKAGDEVRHVAF